MEAPEIELVPGVKWEPVFKTEADYQEFRERFTAAVAPEMERHRRARAQSEHEFFFGRSVRA